MGCSMLIRLLCAFRMVRATFHSLLMYRNLHLFKLEFSQGRLSNVAIVPCTIHFLVFHLFAQCTRQRRNKAENLSIVRFVVIVCHKLQLISRFFCRILNSIPNTN